jgi:N-acetylmuramoyl-L-alanine amidase
MTKQQKYLVIHCLDTPPTMTVSKWMLEEWHKAPRDNSDGTVTYLGKVYSQRSYLPKDKINGVSIKILNGRGWDRLGYSQVIHRSGEAETVTPFKVDGVIEYHEMTWGATGINAVSRHIALEGGWSGQEHNKIFSFWDVFTEGQFVTLMSIINHELDKKGAIQVIGHNQVSSKTCPNFDVPLFLSKVGIPECNLIMR